MAPSNKVNCRKFAKFCFKVIKNECSNIKRAAGIRKDYDATGEEPVEYLLELLTHEDAYTAEHLILTVDGKPCVIESEILFEALKFLPDDQRNVILYDFWLELKDREIAERLEVTVRTVYNLRQRAFKKIRTYYELHGQGRFFYIPLSPNPAIYGRIVGAQYGLTGGLSLMIKILFVCYGNICRSPMAEFILKDMVKKQGIAEQFEIASAATSAEEIWNGVGNPVYPPAREELARHGISCDGKRAVQLKRSDYDCYDYLIGMEEMNIRAMERITGHRGGKIHLLLSFAGRSEGIRDPWYSRHFDETYRDVTEGCTAFLEYLKQEGRLE